jgi:hypothetical protein
MATLESNAIVEFTRFRRVEQGRVLGIRGNKYQVELLDQAGTIVNVSPDNIKLSMKRGRDRPDIAFSIGDSVTFTEDEQLYYGEIAEIDDNTAQINIFRCDDASRGCTQIDEVHYVPLSKLKPTHHKVEFCFDPQTGTRPRIDGVCIFSKSWEPGQDVMVVYTNQGDMAPARIVSIGDKYAVIRWYYSYQQVIADSRIDASRTGMRDGYYALSNHTDCYLITHIVRLVNPQRDLDLGAPFCYDTRYGVLSAGNCLPVKPYYCTNSGEQTTDQESFIQDLFLGKASEEQIAEAVDKFTEKGSEYLNLMLSDVTNFEAVISDVTGSVGEGSRLRRVSDFILEKAELVAFCFLMIQQYCMSVKVTESTYRECISLILSPSRYSATLGSILRTDPSLNDKIFDELFGGLQPKPAQTILLNDLHDTSAPFLIPDVKLESIPSEVEDTPDVIRLTTTPYQWVDLLTDKSTPPIAHVQVSDALFSLKRQPLEVENLQIRCKLIVDELVATRKRRILTMDGHGRTLYYLLYYIKLARIQYPIEIVVCELDPAVQQWHETFFPVSGNRLTIRSKYGDVFKEFMTDTLNLQYLNETVVYLNFCGIGAVKRNLYMLRDNLERYRDTLHGSVYISVAYFMTVNTAIVNKLFGFDAKIKRFTLAEEVAMYPNGTVRPDFRTFRFL